MDTRPDSIDADNAIAQLRRSALDGKLVVVVGTGVSMALTNGKNPALSWKGLIESGFAYGVKKGRIASAQREAWKNQLESRDIDDLLARPNLWAGGLMHLMGIF